MAEKRLTIFPSITSVSDDDNLHINDSITNQDRMIQYDTIKQDLTNNQNKEVIFNSIDTDNVSFRFKELSGVVDGSGFIIVAHGLPDKDKIIGVSYAFLDTGVPFADKNKLAGAHNRIDNTYVYGFNSTSSPGPGTSVNVFIMYID